MELILAITAGALFAVAAYLLLRRSVIKMILGIAVLSQAVNLVILTASGLTAGAAAFVEPGSQALSPEAADPLPQALILTAIVISFGVLAFALALSQRAHEVVGTDDLDQMRGTDH